MYKYLYSKPYDEYGRLYRGAVGSVIEARKCDISPIVERVKHTGILDAFLYFYMVR